jgi:predicted Zn-dependent protease
MTDRQKYIAVAVLAGGAVLAACVENWPRPTHRPTPAAGLDLRGKFIGPAAPDDAAAFAGLCRGVAEALDKDGAAAAPRITTAAQLEDVRIATSEGMFLPESFTRNQPHVSAAAGKFLDQAVGTSGGPIDPAAKAKWSAALRELAQAAEEAVR